MRYAILSDIHGNLEALTAVLEFLASQQIDRYLCLGDTVGYGAEPVACLEQLQRCEAVMVGGNHDLACVGKLDLEWFNETARAALRWTRDHLSLTALDMLRRLPLITTEGPCTLVHATLRCPERFEYLVEAGQAIETMTACRTRYCLVGHTHVPMLIDYDRARQCLTRILTAPHDLAETTLAADEETMRSLINPGSVGQPRDGDPRASVAMLDTERHQLSVHRVPYAIERAARKIQEAGLPQFLADRLRIGR